MIDVFFNYMFLHYAFFLLENCHSNGITPLPGARTEPIEIQFPDGSVQAMVVYDADLIFVFYLADLCILENGDF